MSTSTPDSSDESAAAGSRVGRGRTGASRDRGECDGERGSDPPPEAIRSQNRQLRPRAASAERRIQGTPESYLSIHMQNV